MRLLHRVGVDTAECLRRHVDEHRDILFHKVGFRLFVDARQTLAQLRRTGIRLSIDDYGTGQSNLEYLTEIEADEIKIDKRFVMTMRDSQRNLEVVKSTIDLAHRLGAVAVAEGIEDAETMALLASLGCDVGQGYHLGKPQLFSELTAALSTAPRNRTA